MPRKNQNKGPVPLSEPRKTCPFHGTALRVVELSTGDWQVRGAGWVSTRMFQTEEQAYYYFSYNEGVPPDYKTLQQSIEVKHGTQFPEVKEDQVAEDINRAMKTGEKMAEGLTSDK